MAVDPHEPNDPRDDEAFAFGNEGSGFDYTAFEDSLGEAPDETSREDETLTDPGMVEEQVQSRATIDLRRIPQDDATHEIRELGRFLVLTIRGRVNESFPGATIGEKLTAPVVFDLTEVDRITSFGVRSWLQMFDAASLTEAYFVRASPAVVNQVTMMRNFCGPAKIHSLVAPYLCESCGNEFGVTYDAVADRTALRARNPFVVECPQCRSSAELDEDPWVFFGIDEQLLQEVPPDLQKVVDNLGERPTHAPIEKSLVDDTTRIRFNGAVDGSSRFQSAFAGLEGPIAVDLRTASSVDGAAVEALDAQLRRLDPSVPQALVEGCPLGLLEKLLADPPPRVTVRSVVTEAVSPQRDLRRPVIVDLERHADALRRGVTPDLDLPWHEDTLHLDGLELLGRACAPLPDETSPPAVEAEAQVPRTGPPTSLILALLGGALLVLVALVLLTR